MKWILILWSLSINAELVEIESGIYKEKVGDVAIIETNAEIWIKLNTTELLLEINNLDSYRNHIRINCNRKQMFVRERTGRECENFLKMSNDMITILREKFERLTWERSKRGLVDFMGYGAKILFGTMDSKDRDNIQEKLGSLDGENLKNLKFNFEYAKLVEKTIRSLNTTVTSCNHNGKLINAILDQFEVFQKEANEMSHFVSYLEFIVELKNAFLIMFYETQLKIDDLHQMLIDFHNGIFNTKIIGYKEIIEVLSEMKQVDGKLNFPFGTGMKDFETIRKLVKFVVAQKEEQLIVIFSLPTVSLEEFVLYNVIPIPAIRDNVASF